jgi:hypothetical protein
MAGRTVVQMRSAAEYLVAYITAMATFAFGLLLVTKYGRFF